MFTWSKYHVRLLVNEQTRRLIEQVLMFMAIKSQHDLVQGYHFSNDMLKYNSVSGESRFVDNHYNQRSSSFGRLPVIP